MADIAPASNYINEIDTVNSLYASNYIEVSPASCISLGVSELLFTIGFENVHSDTTRNIFILDTVDNKLDISTLMPVSTSHIMNIYKYTVAEYNIVKFDLPLVTLPDSSQHNRSHGMVQYKIKTRNMTTLGETITARAALNFDNHPVIVTNTVNNTVCDMPTVGNEMIGQSTCSIYPNPTTNELVIGSEPGMFASFSIINTLGQQLLQQETTGSKTIVDVSVLPQGMYYIVLKGENSTVRKFVKW